MQNLINILIRYHSFVLFVLLQAVCFFLIIQYHTHHREIFFKNVYEISGFAFQQRSNVLNYVHLREVNDSLMAENARLRETMPSSFFKHSGALDLSDTLSLRDTLFRQQYQYIPARVINNSVNRPNNYITLDKGQNHNVPSPAGVVTQNGVAGIVTHISAHYSAGMSVLHQDFNLSVKIFESGHIGSLVWEGKNPERLTLHHIPRHKTVKKGQLVVTSPYSRLFPEDINVGIIEDFEVDPVSNFYVISIRPAVIFRDLRYAYIIRNEMAGEQTQLERNAMQW